MQSATAEYGPAEAQAEDAGEDIADDAQVLEANSEDQEIGIRADYH